MLGKYSIFNMLKEAQEKRHIIEAYIRGDTVECYTDDDDSSGEGKALFGFSIGLGLMILLTSLAIFVWAVVVTIKYWNQLPQWSKVLAIVGLVTGIGGPVMTLIVVYVGKGEGKSMSATPAFKFR